MKLISEGYNEDYRSFRERIHRPNPNEYITLKNAVRTAETIAAAYSVLWVPMSAEQRLELFKLAQERAKELSK